MVDHVPTGTPITDEELIKSLRPVPEYQVYSYNWNKYIPWISLQNNVDFQNNYLNARFKYMGILDEELSIYGTGLVGPMPGGGCFIPAEVISLPKEITPQTHDVFIRWVEHSRRIARLKGCRAVAVVNLKEVMTW